MTFGNTNFFSSNSLEKRQVCYKNLNAVVYMLFIGSFVTAIFVKNHAIMDIMYTVASVGMASLLIWSTRKIKRHLKILEPKGVSMAWKTITL